MPVTRPAAARPSAMSPPAPATIGQACASRAESACWISAGGSSPRRPLLGDARTWATNAAGPPGARRLEERGLDQPHARARAGRRRRLRGSAGRPGSGSRLEPGGEGVAARGEKRSGRAASMGGSSRGAHSTPRLYWTDARRRRHVRGRRLLRRRRPPEGAGPRGGRDLDAAPRPDRGRRARRSAAAARSTTSTTRRRWPRASASPTT